MSPLKDNLYRTSSPPEDNPSRTSSPPTVNLRRTTSSHEDIPRRTSSSPEDNRGRSLGKLLTQDNFPAHPSHTTRMCPYKPSSPTHVPTPNSASSSSLLVDCTAGSVSCTRTATALNISILFDFIIRSAPSER